MAVRVPRPAPPPRGGHPRRAAVVLAAVLVLAACGSSPPDALTPAATSVASATFPAPEPAPTPVAAAPAITEPASPPSEAAPAPGPSGPRPANGAVLVKRGKSGRGELAVDNGTDEDAFVTLSQGGKAVRGIYVRQSSNADLSGIADGTYDIFVAQGDGWNRELRRFTDSAEYSKFDETAPFTTARERDGIRYTRLSITLQPVANGNVSTEPVDPDAYPT
jgi:hypothetical protein